MSKRVVVIAALLTLALPLVGATAPPEPSRAKYWALKHTPLPASSTWAILDRDGARRTVPRYLSSLAAGEPGTGTIMSPAFRIAVDRIAFTICGHDGQGGGHQKNYVALIDVRSGKTLDQTMAPGSDAMQEKSWDVSRLQKREVRIEIHDGNAGNAYAWMGVGRIDAGPALRVDFSRGLPAGWQASTPQAKPRSELLQGGIPFLRYPSEYTMIPANGVCELPCGFAAERLFFLGCVVGGAKPAQLYGEIEVVYRAGPSQRIPLMCGYTIEGSTKQLSRSKAVHLHPSSDPFQYYLVVAPRSEVIEKIVLRRNPQQDATVCITAVTCQTLTAHENLSPLPDTVVNAEERAWIESHAITVSAPRIAEIMEGIRRAHKME